MNHKVVKYGILLTREQLDFLKDDNQGFHRMKAFDTFLSLAAIEPFHYEKKNFSADLDIGQFAISKVELAELWHCDRKTAQKMIDLFNEVGILTSVANNRTTIHTIHCLAFWFVNGQNAPIRNPHYQRNPVTQKLAVQGNASSTSSNDNGNSHPQSLTSNNPVPSVAAANDDEREENKPSPYGEDGQLPEDYLEEIDEHYANLPPEADEPYSSSDDTKAENTPIKAKLDDESLKQLHDNHVQWLGQEKKTLDDHHRQQETIWQKHSQRLTEIVKNNEGVWISTKLFYIVGSLSLLSIITIVMEITAYLYFHWIQ